MYIPFVVVSHGTHACGEPWGGINAVVAVTKPREQALVLALEVVLGSINGAKDIMGVQS